MGHPNSKKHKAQHCGYKSKPTKGQVNALMGMYAAISDIQLDSYKTDTAAKFAKPGEQLTLFSR